MKVPSFILAAALCAVASIPAHAYFIDFDLSELGVGKNTTQPPDSVTLESWKIHEPDAALNLQSIEESLISKLGFSYSQPTQSRYSIVSENKDTDDAFTSAWIGKNWRNDLQNGKKALVVTFTQENNSRRVTKGRTDSNDLLLIEFGDAEDNSAGKIAASKSPRGNDWTNKQIWQDESQKLALIENPNVPSVSAAVPEPASFGLALLGVSALAMTRQRVRRKSA